MPECEIGSNNRNISFNQTWLHNAIPLKNAKNDNCFRYARKNLTTVVPGTCSADADIFDTTKKIPCNEFIYASNERNLQTEVKVVYILALSKIGTLFTVE